MLPWQGIVDQSLTPVSFADSYNTLKWTNWQPQLIVLPNTAISTLAQRPNGLSH